MLKTYKEIRAVQIALDPSSERGGSVIYCVGRDGIVYWYDSTAKLWQPLHMYTDVGAEQGKMPL